MNNRLIKNVNYLWLVALYPGLALGENSYHSKLGIISNMMGAIRDLTTKDFAPTLGTVAVLAALIFFFKRAMFWGTCLAIIGICAFGFDGIITMFKGIISGTTG